MVIMMALLALCVLGFWLTQRLFAAYLQFVIHEERHVRQFSRELRPQTAHGCSHHFGPKFFVLLDFAFLATAILCLWHLLSNRPSPSPLMATLEASVIFSLLVTLWLARSHRRLQLYYRRLAAVISATSGETSAVAPRGPVHQSRRSNVIFAVSALCAALPLLLAAFGFDASIWGANTLTLLMMFCLFFVLPQLLLGIAIIRDVWPVRRLVYKN